MAAERGGGKCFWDYDSQNPLSSTGPLAVPTFAVQKGSLLSFGWNEAHLNAEAQRSRGRGSPAEVKGWVALSLQSSPAGQRARDVVVPLALPSLLPSHWLVQPHR